MQAIIIGATSGIGRELAKRFSKEGYVVGITGRREALLDSLEKELNGKCFKMKMDISDPVKTERDFSKLVAEMGKIDVVVISSGIGYIDPNLTLSKDLETVSVNVAGFTVIANLVYQLFCRQNSGHLVGISSVAALRGGPSPAYSASKAYVSNYLEGIACRLYSQRKNVFVTDICPGYVDTAMAKGEGIFWKAPLEKASDQIFKAIQQKRRMAYITKRWRLVALAMSWLPFNLYRKIVSS